MSDPNTPNVPRVPEVPDVPQVPDVPRVPDVPENAADTHGVGEGGTVPPNSNPVPPPAPAYGAPMPPAPAYGAPTPPAYGAPAAGSYTGAPGAKKQVMSIIAMIAGILGVLGSGIAFIPVAGTIMGLLFPVAAVVLGFLGKKKEPLAKGFWMTGIITGFIGVVLVIVFTIILVALLAIVESTPGLTY